MHAQEITIHGKNCAATFSYEIVDELSIKTSRWLDSLGLRQGEHIAILLENRIEFLVIALAAQRLGLYYTPIATHLTAGEINYILSDSGAKILFTSEATYHRILGGVQLTESVIRVVVDESSSMYCNWRWEIEGFSADPLKQQIEGSAMLYSSGTTGKPKGIKKPITGVAYGEQALNPVYEQCFGMDENTVYLSPAPFYHAAPIRASMAVLRFGGSVVILDKFDAEECLRAIETYRVTHVQFVPIMIKRMFALPAEIRAKYDLSSLRMVVHTGEPCPKELKEQMVEWFGNIVCEYYGGTEGNGYCFLTFDEWKENPGSVGKAVVGELHIVDADGQEIGPGEKGAVYFGNGPSFEYHNAPQKLADVTHERGWTTLGDIGYVNERGYLYLTDRASFTINSGGVNIYPREIESVLDQHPKIERSAVFGVPNAEFGEEIKALIVAPELAVHAEAEIKIKEYCRENISSLKCPRSIEFVDSLPCTELGKVLKAEIKQRYWL